MLGLKKERKRRLYPEPVIEVGPISGEMSLLGRFGFIEDDSKATQFIR